MITGVGFKKVTEDLYEASANLYKAKHEEAEVLKQYQELGNRLRVLQKVTDEARSNLNNAHSAMNLYLGNPTNFQIGG